jgi:hypothetical protein
MIIFDLQCANAHTFEGWFEDLKDFETQSEKNFVSCPVCGDTMVTRVPSVFAIKSPGNSSPKTSPPEQELLNKLSQFVEKNFENVGPNFAAEALKMHYGSIEPRNIRGVSTQAEEKLLKEEGVQVLKVPILNRPSSES